MRSLKYKIIIVVGARPNFMKAAPVFVEFKKYKSIKPLLVHTGQHYDRNLSNVFFDDLKLPKPNFYLGVGSGPHSIQTAKIMTEFEWLKIDKNVALFASFALLLNPYYFSSSFLTRIPCFEGCCFLQASHSYRKSSFFVALTLCLELF